jgi:hypothetical protein
VRHSIRAEMGHSCRAPRPWTLAIFQNLTHRGYDVFFDFNGIASGDFERVILGNMPVYWSAWKPGPDAGLLPEL